ncbi:MAG TPA: EAL domain-containing protein [Candidatus Limnocylindria bacterium]|jgi:EAL domain-containing protein (putative c-di-GMP-specific phosphodiesterase class I)|nr:EAL domain-containing protein [Candidatus Limnocylindria bacterium]
MAIVRLRPEELKRALDEGALSLQFQPQVHVPTGKLVGIEAFARWPHPAHGMIGPSDIVPLLDQGSLHVEFDRWVLRAISAQMVAWRDGGVSVPLVAANLWTHTLQRPDVVEMVRDAIASGGVDPREVEIECPRGSVRDPLLAEPVQGIRALGVRVASEEFGDPAIADAASGFDTLKIGYPLARDLPILGTESLEAVQAIVEAARVTGARVVADSVETKDQEDLLVQFGCEIVQGHLYGPEVAPDELKTLLMQGPGRA